MARKKKTSPRQSSGRAKKTVKRAIKQEDLNSQLVSVSWALFLIMIGGLWLIPSYQIHESTWLIGVGIIFLGLNLIRYLNKIKLSWFTVTLGLAALVLGVSGIYGIEFPIFPMILIIIGANIIFDIITKHQG